VDHGAIVDYYETVENRIWSAVLRSEETVAAEVLVCNDFPAAARAGNMSAVAARIHDCSAAAGPQTCYPGSVVAA